MKKNHINKNIKILMISLLCSLAFIGANAQPREKKEKIDIQMVEDNNNMDINEILKNLRDMSENIPEKFVMLSTDEKNINKDLNEIMKKSEDEFISYYEKNKKLLEQHGRDEDLKKLKNTYESLKSENDNNKKEIIKQMEESRKSEINKAQEIKNQEEFKEKKIEEIENKTEKMTNTKNKEEKRKFLDDILKEEAFIKENLDKFKGKKENIIARIRIAIHSTMMSSLIHNAENTKIDIKTRKKNLEELEKIIYKSYDYIFLLKGRNTPYNKIINSLKILIENIAPLEEIVENNQKDLKIREESLRKMKEEVEKISTESYKNYYKDKILQMEKNIKSGIKENGEENKNEIEKQKELEKNKSIIKENKNEIEEQKKLEENKSIIKENKNEIEEQKELEKNKSMVKENKNEIEEQKKLEESKSIIKEKSKEIMEKILHLLSLKDENPKDEKDANQIKGKIDAEISEIPLEIYRLERTYIICKEILGHFNAEKNLEILKKTYEDEKKTIDSYINSLPPQVMEKINKFKIIIDKEAKIKQEIEEINKTIDNDDIIDETYLNKIERYIEKREEKFLEKMEKFAKEENYTLTEKGKQYLKNLFMDCRNKLNTTKAEMRKLRNQDVKEIKKLIEKLDYNYNIDTKKTRENILEEILEQKEFISNNIEKFSDFKKVEYAIKVLRINPLKKTILSKNEEVNSKTKKENLNKIEKIINDNLLFMSKETREKYKKEISPIKEFFEKYEDLDNFIIKIKNPYEPINRETKEKAEKIRQELSNIKSDMQFVKRFKEIYKNYLTPLNDEILEEEKNEIKKQEEKENKKEEQKKLKSNEEIIEKLSPIYEKIKEKYMNRDPNKEKEITNIISNNEKTVKEIFEKADEIPTIKNYARYIKGIITNMKIVPLKKIIENEKAITEERKRSISEIKKMVFEDYGYMFDEKTKKEYEAYKKYMQTVIEKIEPLEKIARDNQKNIKERKEKLENMKSLIETIPDEKYKKEALSKIEKIENEIKKQQEAEEKNNNYNIDKKEINVDEIINKLTQQINEITSFYDTIITKKEISKEDRKEYEEKRKKIEKEYEKSLTLLQGDDNKKTRLIETYNHMKNFIIDLPAEDEGFEKAKNELEIKSKKILENISEFYYNPSSFLENEIKQELENLKKTYEEAKNELKKKNSKYTEDLEKIYKNLTEEIKGIMPNEIKINIS